MKISRCLKESWYLKAGVVTQWWKHLPGKPEDWSLEPLNPCKFEVGIAAHW